jgi:ATP synthase protein I
MIARADEPKTNSCAASPDGLAAAVQKRQERRTRWLNEGEPSVVRFVGQIGVLGWIIVVPALIGLFLGRWLDHKLGSGIFWSAPLLLLGVVVGFWSAWRWMHRQ